MEEKIKYPKGIYGDPSIPSQKLTRNKDYYGQIREDIDAHLEYLLELKSKGQKYAYFDMFIQKENRKRLRFIVVEPKKKID
jgi:hypothetical protein